MQTVSEIHFGEKMLSIRSLYISISESSHQNEANSIAYIFCQVGMEHALEVCDVLSS